MQLLLNIAAFMHYCSNYRKKAIKYYSREGKINRQAAAAYENFRNKSKLITKGSKLREIRNIGKKWNFL